MTSGALRRVLVTGHDGYIGSVLVTRFLQRGYEVAGLDTFYYEDCWFGDGRPTIASMRKDLRDVQMGDLEGFDAVIHLAALSNDPVGELSPELTLEINHEATVRLAACARDAGVRRFLYASSCSLYGQSGEAWVNEDSPLAPLTAYGVSKVKAEREIVQLADERFTPVVLRCATVYGISPKLRADLVVNNLVGWGVTVGEIRILSDGTPWRPLIHVEDLAAAYEFFLDAPVPAIHTGVFNVGFNTQNYQVRAIAEQVHRTLPQARITFAPTPDRDTRSYRVRFDRFAALSGLTPQWNLGSGIQQVADGYLRLGMTRDLFESHRYVRVKHIRHLLGTQALDATLRWRRP